jgi:hypothetical protein
VLRACVWMLCAVSCCARVPACTVVDQVALMSSWFAEWVGARAVRASPSPRHHPEARPAAGIPSSPSRTAAAAAATAVGGGGSPSRAELFTVQPGELLGSPSRLPAARHSAPQRAWEAAPAAGGRGVEVEVEEDDDEKELPGLTRSWPPAGEAASSMGAALSEGGGFEARVPGGQRSPERLQVGGRSLAEAPRDGSDDARRGGSQSNVLVGASSAGGNDQQEQQQQRQPQYGLYYDEEKKCWLSVDFDATAGSHAAAAFAAASAGGGDAMADSQQRSASVHSSAELRASGGSDFSSRSMDSHRSSSGQLELPPPELGETGSSAKVYADGFDDHDAENEAELGSEGAGDHPAPRTAFLSRPHPSRSSQPGGFGYASRGGMQQQDLGDADADAQAEGGSATLARSHQCVPTHNLPCRILLLCLFGLRLSTRLHAFV